MPFSIERHATEGALRLIIRGEVDAETGPRVEDELHRLEAEAADTLVLDLTGVAFLDSTGLQIVLDAEVRARERGRRFLLAVDGGEPLRVLQLAEVLDRIELET